MTQDEWNACTDGAELLRFVVDAGVDRKVLVTAVCACARLALPYVTRGEDRPLKAIEAAEGWTRGEVSVENVLAAETRALGAPSSASRAAHAGRQANAVYAAVHAARVVYSPNAAVHVVVDVSYAAPFDRLFWISRCADAIRTHIPYRLVAISILEEV